jgi:hypothetical protein
MTLSLEDEFEKNVLTEFVTLARECFSAKYPNQDFGASRWDYSHLLTSRTRRSDRYLHYVRYQRGMTKKSVLQAEALPNYFSDVVKSILLLNSNTLIRIRLNSFRVLWECLLARFGGNGSTFRWYLLREADVLNADHLMRVTWSDSTVYLSISSLVSDLQRLADRNIVPRFDIVPEIPSPRSTDKSTLEGNDAAIAKLPSQAVPGGLADMYALHAVNAPDRSWPTPSPYSHLQGFVWTRC